MRPRCSEMGPYAAWVASCVDALEAVTKSPVHYERTIDELSVRYADKLLAQAGIRPYAGPYIRAVQPRNMDYQGKKNASIRDVPVRGGDILEDEE